MSILTAPDMVEIAPPAAAARLWRRLEAVPAGVVAHGRPGRFQPRWWEVFVDDQDDAWLCLHSRKPAELPPVVIRGPRADVLALLSGAYWALSGEAESEGESENKI